MTLARRLGATALICYCTAWVLPSMVIHIPDLTTWGPSHREVVRGWEATRVALSPILPGPTYVTAGWSTKVLVVASGLSNVLFVVGLFLVARWPQRVSVRWEAALWLATVVNTQWFVRSGDDRRDLRVGYYLWFLAFVLLAGCLRVTRRAARGTAIVEPAA